MKHIYIFLIFISFNYQTYGAGFLKSLIVSHKNTASGSSYSQKHEAWFAAAFGGKITDIQELVKKIDVNVKNKHHGETALIVAARNGRENIVRFLIQIPDIKVNAKDNNGNTALISAIAAGNEKIIELLLAAPGININIKNLIGWTALLKAIDLNLDSITQILLKTPGIVTNPHGDLIFAWAAEYNLENILKHFLKILAQSTQIDAKPVLNINAQDSSGRTALFNTALYGRDKIAKLLLEVPHIDVNIQDKQGETALMFASQFNRKDIIQMLLAVKNININITNYSGKTAVMLAGGRYPWHISDIKNLITNKVTEITIKAFSAIKNHNLDMLKAATLQIGIDDITDADLSRRDIDDAEADLLKTNANTDGNTLLDKAFSENCPEIIEFLLQNAKDPRELLARMPFELISPSSQVFEFMLDLAYASGAPKAQHDSKFCTVCTKPTDQICSRCKKIYYCCAACQKADWKHHKHNCVAAD